MMVIHVHSDSPRSFGQALERALQELEASDCGVAHVSHSVAGTVNNGGTWWRYSTVIVGVPRLVLVSDDQRERVVSEGGSL